MKILFVSGSYPPIHCGVGDYLKTLTDELTNQGHEVRIITSIGAQAGPTTRPVVSRWNVLALPRIVKEIRAWPCDVIHFQYPSVRYPRRPFVNLLPNLLRILFPKIPVVITIHEYHDASLLGRFRVLLTVILVKFVSVSNSEDYLVLKGIFTHKQISQIPIGSNIERVEVSPAIKRELKQKYDLDGSSFNLVFFGYIDPSKGIENLVKAMAETEGSRLILLAECNPENPYHNELKDDIKRADNKIVWTGYQSAVTVSAVLQLSDVALLPFNQPASLRRGSLVAALAHGIPVITTGPVLKPLENEANCLAVANNDSSTLTQAIKKLRNDTKLRSKLASGAEDLAKQLTWPLIAGRFSDLYRLAAKKPQSKEPVR